MYPVLFSIAGFQLSSFSIFFILAWCVFSFVFWKSLRDEGVGEEHIFDLTFWATIAALIAARGGFVLTHWDQFDGAYLRIVALWVAPGMSLLVGLAAGLAVMVRMGKRRKVRVGAILDAFSLAIPGALIVGEVGSLLDGSQIGRATNLPWAIRYVGLPEARHPYQLYLILALAMVLVAVGWISERARRRKWPLGSTGVGFFLLFAPLVFGLEFLKDNQVYWYRLSANQWLALVLFVAAAVNWYAYIGGKFIVREFSRRMYERIPKRRS